MNMTLRIYTQTFVYIYTIHTHQWVSYIYIYNSIGNNSHTQLTAKAEEKAHTPRNARRIAKRKDAFIRNHIVSRVVASDNK